MIMGSPRGLRGLSVWILAGVLAGNVSVAGDRGDVKAALKQVTRAMKGVRGIVADVEYDEVVRKRPIGGTGTLSVSFDGKMRAEVGGSSPRTMLLTPPYLYVHQKPDEIVEVHDLTANPHLLAQYALLGFSPAGSAMKKSFRVELVENATLGGRPVVGFLLTPKSEEVDRAIARIQLWIDPESGLPLRQKIVHAAAETDLDIRYLNVSIRDEFEVSVFRPAWPDGVRIIRKH